MKILSVRLLVALLWGGCFLLQSAGAGASEDTANDPDKEYRKNKGLQILCQETAQHIPWDDVKYKGGIDQKGNFVVAADIGVTFAPMEYPIDIPLQLDLLKKFNMNVPLGIIAEPEIAGLKIYQDGTVKYNGQDVTQPVGIFCRDHVIDPALLEKAAEGEAPAKEHSSPGAPIGGEAH